MPTEAHPTDQRSPHPSRPDVSANSPPDGTVAALVLTALKEMGEQRRALQEEHARAAAERRSERRWRMVFQFGLIGIPFLFGLLYFLFFLSTTGFRWGPLTSVVGVVRIDGEIAANKIASADNISAALDRAMTNAQVKAVVLAIDSPGGAPVEAERIYRALETLRKKYDKPVVSVINSLGASAAYMIALHTDRIIAGKYSLVGSIGAVMAPWQLDKAIARLDVSQRIYASGKLKAFLNPFTPVTPEADLKAQALVQNLAAQFLTEVRIARGKSLKPGVDLATGEIWDGLEAQSLGLIDGIGTLEDVVASTWNLKTYDFGPEPPSMGYFSKAISGSVQTAIESALARMQMPSIR